MLRELGGLWRLFRGALGFGRIDAVVSATSPPMLVVMAALVSKLRRARHYHWLFDMYPELATALGEIPEGAMARLFSAATRWAYRSADCVVALDEDMAARLKGYGVTARIIPPWVCSSLIGARAAEPLDGPPHGSDECVWLYSGNLGRAHEWKTLLDAQRLIEASGAPWRLVFQGGGPAWPAAQEYARRVGLTRCDWRPYVPEEQLPPLAPGRRCSGGYPKAGDMRPALAQQARPRHLAPQADPLGWSHRPGHRPGPGGVAPGGSFRSRRCCRRRALAESFRPGFPLCVPGSGGKPSGGTRAMAVDDQPDLGDSGIRDPHWAYWTH